MTVISDPELLSFAAEVLERHGGLIESAGERLMALMPPALAQSLELPEEIEFGTEAAPLLYGSPLLDRLVGLAIREVPVAYGQIEVPYLKKAGFEQLLGRDLAFAGAQVHWSSRAEARATYLILFCHYVALSDERKEGLVTLGLHEASGAVIPGLAGQWEAGRPRFFPAGQVPSHFPLHLEAALAGALKSARTAVAAELKGFLAGMQRRLGRDVKNTREYYAALRQEMEMRLSHVEFNRVPATGASGQNCRTAGRTGPENRRPGTEIPDAGDGFRRRRPALLGGRGASAAGTQVPPLDALIAGRVESLDPESGPPGLRELPDHYAPGLSHCRRCRP